MAIINHEVNSNLQAGSTLIRVLVPDNLDGRKPYPVVYVLPVEKLNENRFGDGLLEVQTRNLHNQYQAIFVAPTFAHLPWYADHPTDPRIQQETYFLNVVLPLVEKTYPIQPGASGRYLLGFSKSGWGAFSLLLRHPDRFAKAAAWDAPLMMLQPNNYGMEEIFGSQANFEKYQISGLLEERATDPGIGGRLILVGHGNFAQHMQNAHDLMVKLKIAHEYHDGPSRVHVWHSGWVPEAVEALLAANSLAGK